MVLHPSKTMVVNTQNASSQYHFASSGEQNDRLIYSIGPLKYHLKMVQEPKRSRMSGVGDKPNRRTIDPPPVAQVEIFDQHGTDVTYPLMETSAFFSETMLVQADTKEPVGPVYYNDRVMMPLVGDRTVFVQRAYGASDVEVEAPDYKAVCPFSDLSVRQEGRYRLQIDLFEIVQGEVIHRATVHTLPFRTFTPKKFPGMQSSTDTTAELKRNGVKMRYKKSIRINTKMKLDLEETSNQRKLQQRAQGHRTVTTSMNISKGQQPSTWDQPSQSTRIEPSMPPTPRIHLPIPEHSGPASTSLPPIREQRDNASHLSPPPYQNSVRRYSEENYGRRGEASSYFHPQSDHTHAIRHHIDHLPNNPYPTPEQRRYSQPTENLYRQHHPTHRHPSSRLPNISDMHTQSRDEFIYDDPVYGPNATPDARQPARNPRDGTAYHEHQYQGGTPNNDDDWKRNNNY